MNAREAKKIRKIIAHTVQAATRPKPRFLPRWIWKRIVRRVVVLEKVANSDQI